jgi:hypothetical protein
LLREVFAPGLHLAYAAAWFFALQGALSVACGAPLGVDLASAAAVLAMFAVLFFLRLVDEWKDAAYDRVHNPDRPLARGAVTTRELFAVMAGVAFVAVAASATVSPLLVFVAAADMGWALVLVALERWSRRVRDGMILNLLVTYPVNVALSVYGWAFFASRAHAYEARADVRGALVVVAFAFAFLVYEVLRKTQWPEAARARERLYSAALGPRAAIAVALLCASFAAGTLAPLFWARGAIVVVAATALPLFPAALAGARFFAARPRRVKLVPLGTTYLLVFYGGLVVATTLTRVFGGP